MSNQHLTVSPPRPANRHLLQLPSSSGQCTLNISSCFLFCFCIIFNTIFVLFMYNSFLINASLHILHSTCNIYIKYPFFPLMCNYCVRHTAANLIKVYIVYIDVYNCKFKFEPKFKFFILFRFSMFLFLFVFFHYFLSVLCLS